jgi:tRNA-splicing ligase RtcB
MSSLQLASRADQIREISPVEFELPKGSKPGMRVPARVFADRQLLERIAADRSLEQLQNVATLPGIVEAALAMPDIHQGYGFPVGGVAAMDASCGVISPGGVGYDINCGVRLLALPVSSNELSSDQLRRLVEELARRVPVGPGRGGELKLSGSKLDRVLAKGPRALLTQFGIGSEEEIAHTESEGALEGAEPGCVSAKARERGGPQLGTLGSGNHFLELQRVERLFDTGAARCFGLEEDQLTVLIHSGSRGLGHQVCSDYVRIMEGVAPRYGISLPDRELACAPVDSPEARRYIGAMAAAANFAWANRAVLAYRVREAIAAVLGDGAARRTRQIYDVAHNIAKLERHGGRHLWVHRKGATRAFGPSSKEIPATYRAVGQPVFVPGSMGTASYVLAGLDSALERSFGSACHGAGRQLSRAASRKQTTAKQLRSDLERAGVVVRSASARGLVEEAPFAYKDVDHVVAVVERAGLAKRVARLRPLGVIKG